MATKSAPYRTPVLIPHIKKQVESTNKAWPYSAPSNIVNLCPRQFFFAQRVNTTYVRKLRDILNFSMGFWAEDFIEKVMEAGKVQILQKEVVIEPDKEDLHGFTSLSARVDFFIKFNGDYYIAEIKKMNPRRFNNFRVRGLMTEEAAHFQLMYYLFNWQKAIKQGADLPPIKKGILVGVQAEPTDILDTSVEYNEEDYLSFRKKLNLIQALIENPEDKEDFGPPGRPEGYNYTNPVCRSCNFFDVCYQDIDSKLIVDSSNMNTELSKDEQELLTSVLLDLELASKMSDDANLMNKNARETLVGFMTSRKLVSLEFTATIGSLLSELGSHETIKLDSEIVRENDPELHTKAQTITKVHDLNTKIKIDPLVKSMMAAKIAKINPDGSIVYRNKHENNESLLADPEEAS